MATERKSVARIKKEHEKRKRGEENKDGRTKRTTKQRNKQPLNERVSLAGAVSAASSVCG